MATMIYEVGIGVHIEKISLLNTSIVKTKPNMKKSKIIHSCKVPVMINLGGQIDHIRRAINMSLVGTPVINQVDETGKCVPKIFPQNKLNILTEAHYAILRSHVKNVEFDITDHGEFINFRFSDTNIKN